jgi:hypothetical protein
VVAIPCIIDRSRILTFSYFTSHTCICQLFQLSNHFKVFDSLMQVVWVSKHKHTDCSWRPIPRIIRLQPSDLWLRYPLYILLWLPSVGIMALFRNVLKKKVILGVSYVMNDEFIIYCTEILRFLIFSPD